MHFYKWLTARILKVWNCCFCQQSHVHIWKKCATVLMASCILQRGGNRIRYWIQVCCRKYMKNILEKSRAFSMFILLQWSPFLHAKKSVHLYMSTKLPTWIPPPSLALHCIHLSYACCMFTLICKSWMAFAARNQTEQARVCRRDDQDRTMYQEGADTHVKFWAS